MAETLNPAQLDAVRYLQGPCLVLAGAGSGKTLVIDTCDGFQFPPGKRSACYVLTVCLGDVAAMPEPQPLAPLLAGLTGLRRARRLRQH